MEVEEGRSLDHFEYGSNKLYRSTDPATYGAEHPMSLTFEALRSSDPSPK